MKSKYKGFCKKCKKPWNKGDEIKNEDGQWVHDICPKYSSFKSVVTGAGINVPVQIAGETLPEIQKEFIPSHYQQAIFEDIKYGMRNIVVKAGAGSGKTTTIIQALNLIPTDKRVVFVAFNKRIVKAIKDKLLAMGLGHIKVATIHSMGLTVIKKLGDFKDVDEEKLSDLMERFYPISKDTPKEEKKVNRQKRYLLRKIAEMAKATLVDADNPVEVAEMIERYNIVKEGDFKEHILELISVLPKLLKACMDNPETVDFSDMVWLPVVHHLLKLHPDKYDYILLDEAQDVDKCQTEFLLNSLAPGGRIIAVGDQYQSLYAFRGADAYAIPNLIERLDAQVLPLSISYRCPKSHIELAREFMPDIEAAPDAIDGIVENITGEQFITMLEESDMVLCRNNAPLVKPAYQVIKSGKKAVIAGKDIGRDLIKFIERFEADSLNQLEVLMNEYAFQEIERLLEKGREIQAEMVKDNYETIISVSNECKTILELVEKIAILFSDENVGVVFSTVHKAKGLEAERVFILRYDLIPHPKAKQVWEVQQERNLKGVALTRSKRELYFVQGEE